MRRALRFCMVALVVVNLGFVHITESSDLTWLLPLLVLTVLSPWLLKLTRFWAYRLLWNLSVLGAFALLVHHVTYAGVAFLLEDGLLLAALCQVHLINNLSDAQKPDLIFFNSFLIAVVTSYLSVDLGYSVMFLVYAPLFVIALQLLTVSRSGVEEEPGLVWRVSRAGLVRGAGVIGITLLVFLFFPRDFKRKGLLGDSLQLRPPGSISEVAFSERVNLDQSRQVLVSDRVIMTVQAEPGARFGVPAHWRGATLDEFNGRVWSPTRNPIFEKNCWSLKGPDTWGRDGAGPKRTLDVHLADPSASRVFTPLEARRVKFGSSRQIVRPLKDRNFRRVSRTRRPLRYAVDVALERPAVGGRQVPMTVEAQTHRNINPALVPRGARRLARELRRELPDDVEQHVIVTRFSNYLTSRYRYLAPGAEGGAQNLSEFLAGKGGAHCEYFATALAVMLRGERIPCRVVTGYRSEEWDEKAGRLTIRARHAHAWVEVLDPQAGWYTVDPTPAVGVGPAATSGGFFADLKEWAAAVWAGITNFNGDSYRALLAWCRDFPGRILDHAGATALCLVGLVLVFVALRLRRAGRIEPAIRAYERGLRKLRLTLEPGETPRDLLARARRTAYPTDGLRQLEAVTAAHERARYSA